MSVIGTERQYDEKINLIKILKIDLSVKVLWKILCQLFILIVANLGQVNNIKHKIAYFCFKFTIDKTHCECYN